MKRLFAAAVLICSSLSARADIVDVGNEELTQLMAKGVKLIDLRTAGEWHQTGVVAGSHMVTLFDEKGRANPDWSREVNAISAPDQPIALICRSGNRTRVAAKLLSEATPARKIYNVRAGMNGWTQAAQPVVSPQQNLRTEGVRCVPVC